MNVDGITLWAEDLYSKYGFYDGDLVNEFIYANDYDTDPAAPHIAENFNGVYHKDVLCLLVRRHLLPALPRQLDVIEIITRHNPIRANDYMRPTPDDLKNIKVFVSSEQIIQAANDVAQRKD